MFRLGGGNADSRLTEANKKNTVYTVNTCTFLQVEIFALIRSTDEHNKELAIGSMHQLVAYWGNKTANVLLQPKRDIVETLLRHCNSDVS